MKNYVSDGETLDITAADAVASGGGVLAGTIFGVATGDITAGAQGVIGLCGVYDLPKAASQAWTIGAKVYWDNAAKVCTTVATSNTLIGIACLTVGGTSDEIIGRVRLNGTA